MNMVGFFCIMRLHFPLCCMMPAYCDSAPYGNARFPNGYLNHKFSAGARYKKIRGNQTDTTLAITAAMATI